MYITSQIFHPLKVHVVRPEEVAACMKYKIVIIIIMKQLTELLVEKDNKLLKLFHIHFYGLQKIFINKDNYNQL